MANIQPADPPADEPQVQVNRAAMSKPTDPLAAPLIEAMTPADPESPPADTRAKPKRKGRPALPSGAKAQQVGSDDPTNGPAPNRTTKGRPRGRKPKATAVDNESLNNAGTSDLTAPQEGAPAKVMRSSQRIAQVTGAQSPEVVKTSAEPGHPKMAAPPVGVQQGVNESGTSKATKSPVGQKRTITEVHESDEALDMPVNDQNVPRRVRASGRKKSRNAP